jgi:hypothetical protein
MELLNGKDYKQFSDLPLQQFDHFSFSVYVLDRNWNYLYVNEFVKKNLGSKGQSLVGQNMWASFPELTVDPTFMVLKANTEKGVDTQVLTTSPLTSQRLSITGRVLSDCSLFTSTVLPKKEELLHELRNVLEKK